LPGVEFKSPGVKSNRDQIMEKLELKGGAEKVTDLARGSFLVNDPGQVAPLVEALAKQFGVAEEDWRTTPFGYGDKAFSSGSRTA
jgi:hypothetical protein